MAFDRLRGLTQLAGGLRFPLGVNDMLFWGIFGILVTINAGWQFKRGSRRTGREADPSLRVSAIYVAKVMGMFSLM